MHLFAPIFRECLVLIVVVSFSLAGQRLLAEPEPEELKTLAGFTLSYTSSSSPGNWSASVSGGLQPDGKLALEMKRSQLNRGAKDRSSIDWTAVASPELKERLMGFIGTQWRDVQPGSDIQLEKDRLIRAGNSPEQAAEKSERRLENKNTRGGPGARLSFAFSEQKTDVHHHVADIDTVKILIDAVYAATRDKDAQRKDAYPRDTDYEKKKEEERREVQNEQRRQDRNEAVLIGELRLKLQGKLNEADRRKAENELSLLMLDQRRRENLREDG